MYVSDMHTHSIASGHGTMSTITAMAKEASRKGLKLLGITDHGPATLAAGTASYFRSLLYSPRRRFDVDLLYGVELNILDVDGHVDLADPLLSRLDYAIVSMHRQNYTSGTAVENTQAYIRAMQHPAVRILGHCDSPAFPVDYDELAAAAKEHNVIFEINEASLAPYGYRGDTRANCLEILRVSASHGLPIVLSSDSHGPEHVGDFTCAAEFVHQALFPESEILNNQLPRLRAFLMTR
ncbi:MAG: phosphatase [Blautia sp.]|nr:phosphatase [Blautia sp.]